MSSNYYNTDDGQIDLNNAVDMSHNLAQGRWGWWLGLHGITRGGLFHNVMPGSAFDATLNSASWVLGQARPGMISYCPSFSGSTSSYGEITPADQYSGNVPWSVGAWVYFTNSASAIEIVLFNGTDSSGLKKAIFLYRNASGKAVIETGAGGGASTGTTTLAAATWYRLVATYDLANTRIYVNGLLEHTTAFTGMNLTPGHTTLGVYYNVSSGRMLPMNGRIDDAFIQHRTLLASEIWQDYQLSRIRYPGVLNRVRSEYGFTPAAGGIVPNPYFFRMLSGAI